MSHRAAFLDRDGVINPYVYNAQFGTVDSPARPEEFMLKSGAGRAIAELNKAGLLAIIVSNQPGVAKGKFTPELLQEITRKMEAQVAEAGAKLDGVYYCLHHPEGAVAGYREECACRKPKPGLLFQAAQDWGINLNRSYMVGDGITDILAGQAAGTKTLLISARRSYLYDELTRQGAWPDFFVSDLAEAVETIGRMEKEGSRAVPGEDSRSAYAVTGTPSSYPKQFFEEAGEVLRRLDPRPLEQIADFLAELRERKGRLFLLGSGGGAGHASHAACDFRKIAGIEAYSVSDNVSELTARINDEGWETAYAEWLRGSHLDSRDMVFVFSVGGGDAERNISPNLVRALEYAKEVGARICGVVGRDGGFTAKAADACVVVPVVNPATVTPHTESFQAMVWHLLVTHPRLKAAEMKWESVR